jgi:transposase
MADTENSYEAPYEHRKSARTDNLIIEVREPPRKRTWTAAQKQMILAEATAPGAIAAQVMRRHGLASSVFYAWKQRLRAPAPAGFLPVAIAEAAAPAPQSAIAVAGAALEIVLPNGVVVRINGVVDARALEVVLAALQRPC